MKQKFNKYENVHNVYQNVHNKYLKDHVYRFLYKMPIIQTTTHTKILQFKN